MLPKEHFAYAVIPAIAIYFYNPFYAILFLASTILTDIDHYIAYVLAFKKYNIISSINFYPEKLRPYLKRTNANVFLIFHNIETFIILLIISAFFPPAYFIFFGISMHYLLDLCCDYVINKRFPREESAVLYLFKKNKFSLKDVM